jgi:D-lactate dehydrogenase
MTPRQRIVIQREIARLTASQENGERLSRLERLQGDYVYPGEQTCAADGLCATACPVSINTGDLTKYLRSLNRSALSVAVAQWTADHYSLASSGVRAGLRAVNMAHALLGTSLMAGISRGMRTLAKNRIPQWNPFMPKGISAPRFRDRVKGSDLKVVYFPSCVVRTMGPAKGDEEQRPVFDAMLSVLEKAGYDVLFPRNMENLCCGITYESKGFVDQADQKSGELEEELFFISRAGKYPILCDTSPCLYRMRRKLNSGLRLYEPVEFIHDFLRDRLEFKRTPGTIAVHVTCSSTKMGLNEKFRTVARACGKDASLGGKLGCRGQGLYLSRAECIRPFRIKAIVAPGLQIGVFKQPDLRDRALPSWRNRLPVDRLSCGPVYGKEARLQRASGSGNSGNNLAGKGMKRYEVITIRDLFSP